MPLAVLGLIVPLPIDFNIRDITSVVFSRIWHDWLGSLFVFMYTKSRPSGLICGTLAIIHFQLEGIQIGIAWFKLGVENAMKARQGQIQRMFSL